MKKAVFLDRDGVINKNVELLNKKEDLELLEGSAEAIKILNDNDFIVVIVTNQPVIARGIITKKQVEAINKELEKKIYGKSGGLIDKIYFCPHHPNADLEEYKKICECRKPCFGMLKKAEEEFLININESFMIGDMLSDIAAGKGIGCKTILIKSKENKKIIKTGKGFKIVNPDYKFDNFLQAVKFIIK